MTKGAFLRARKTVAASLRTLTRPFAVGIGVGALILLVGQAGFFRTRFFVATLVLAAAIVVGFLVWRRAISPEGARAKRDHAEGAWDGRDAHFHHLIGQQCADAIALIGADGNFLYQSPAAARVLGMDPAPLLGASFVGTIHPDDQERAREAFLNVLRAPATRASAEVRFAHPDGTWHWMEATLTNMLDEPNVNAVVSNYRDVTQMRGTVQALKDSEERFREIAEYIQEAFFVTDMATSQPLYVSPNWSVIWGRPLEEGYDPEVWSQAIHPDDRERMAVSQALVHEGRSQDDVFRIVRPDGKQRWVHARVFPVTDSAGRVYRTVGVAADITELRQAEWRFAQAQKMEAMGRLAGGVAHDFNNLLTVISGEAELLQQDIAADTDQGEMLRDIRHAAASAAGLTRQLLAFSRKQLVEPSVFDLNTAIEDTSKMLRRLIGENVQLETRLEPVLGMVRLDRGQFEQVLTNLAVNAKDAMPNGGLLVLETAPVELDQDYAMMYPEVRAGDYVLLSVGDTGVGMSPEVKANVFDPFFTTKERGHGTGLGLAMIHGIVKQAGGHIAVYSEPNIGTTFRLYFPRIMEPDRPERRPVEVTGVPRGDETILLVEDEDLVRRVASRMLASLGYTVLEARDATEAQEALATPGSKVQLLFTDVVLPGMQGRELAALVKGKLPAMRVLFTSGYSDDVILQHQLLSRDVTVVQKPYNRDELARKVREVLDA